MNLYFIKNKMFRAPSFSYISFYFYRLEVKDIHVKLGTVCRAFSWLSDLLLQHVTGKFTWNVLQHRSDMAA